jgi:hypothetical protein
LSVVLLFNLHVSRLLLPTRQNTRCFVKRAELQQPSPGEDRKQLVGGVFDLDLHPSISRYNNSAELSYRPLKFVPVQNARISVQ